MRVNCRISSQRCHTSPFFLELVRSCLSLCMTRSVPKNFNIRWKLFPDQVLLCPMHPRPMLPPKGNSSERRQRWWSPIHSCFAPKWICRDCCSVLQGSTDQAMPSDKSRERRDSNPGQLGEKCEGYLCAVSSPAFQTFPAFFRFLSFAFMKKGNRKEEGKSMALF